MKYDVRFHQTFDYCGMLHKSFCTVQCPFCGTRVKAYVWSLAGSGKKCPNCRAVHYSYYSRKKVTGV